MIYNLVYSDGKTGVSYIKRFPVTAITRDKPYDLTKGNKGSRVLYFTANPNSESEIITVHLSSKCRARIKVFDFDFGDLTIKGRGAQGNILSKYPVQKIVQKEVGTSTLGGLDLWYDDAVGRLNTDERGNYLGNFEGDDLILSVNKEGHYRLSEFDLSNHYDPEKTLIIEQYNPETVIAAIYYHGEKKRYYVKRFKVETLTQDKPFPFIADEKGSFLAMVTTSANPQIEMHYLKGKSKTPMKDILAINDLVDIKGWKAQGNILSTYRVTGVKQLESSEPEIIIADPESTENPDDAPDKDENQMDLFSKKT
jgi:topoisomerase-4 subunit A